MRTEPRPTDLIARRVCVFCGIPRKMSEEHIISDWISQSVIKKTGKSSHHHNAKFDLPHIERLTKTRQGDLANRRFKVVCEICNNGWMSKVETSAQPVLTKLILGEKHFINQGEQEKISTWATLKTMVLHATKSGASAINRKQYESFFSSPAPLQNSNIFIGSYSEDDWRSHKIITHINARIGPSGKAEKNYPINTQSTSICVGKFYVYIFSSSIDKSNFSFTNRLRMRLKPIWPITRINLQWPIRMGVTATEVEQSSFMLSTIA